MIHLHVAGIGTEVGKTVVAAILTSLFEADYWKPISCGGNDHSTVKELVEEHVVHPCAISLEAPLSPHHAARLEGKRIDCNEISPPKTVRPLIIEGVGGVLVPLTTEVTTLDLFTKWGGKWVVVSRHYLGSINHTLMTLEILKRHKIAVAGLIFNGEPNPDSEAAILAISNLPVLGRLLPEKEITKETIKRYKKQWTKSFSHLLA